MKKAEMILIGLLIAFSSFSQNYYPLEQIEEIIKDSTSNRYYPTLMKRFNDFDSTLRADDYILIYYGFGYQENYNGYRKDPTSIYNQLFDNKEYELILTKCDSVLKEIPVCISSNLYKGKVLKILYPETVEYKKYMERSFSLMDVLFNSGDGKTINTAYKILFLSDEKRIMFGYLELQGYTKQALIDHYDELTVKKSKKFDKKKIYFDVYLPLMGNIKLFRKENK